MAHLAEASFSAGLTRGLLILQKCASCGSVQTGVRARCAQCGSRMMEPYEASRNGTVYARTRIFRAPSAAFRSVVPYDLCLVDLAEGARIMGHCAPEVEIGDKVTARIATIADENLLFFEKAMGPGAVASGGEEA